MIIKETKVQTPRRINEDSWRLSIDIHVSNKVWQRRHETEKTESTPVKSYSIVMQSNLLRESVADHRSRYLLAMSIVQQNKTHPTGSLADTGGDFTHPNRNQWWCGMKVNAFIGAWQTQCLQTSLWSTDGKPSSHICGLGRPYASRHDIDGYPCQRSLADCTKQIRATSWWSVVKQFFNDENEHWKALRRCLLA